MSNNGYHFVSAQEFCTGCGRTLRCEAIVETNGRIDCWCEKCWGEFLGLAYEAMDRISREKLPNIISGDI